MSGIIKTNPEKILYADISVTDDVLFEVAEDVEVTINVWGRVYQTIIKKGFQTNFGSVPSSVVWLIPKSGIYNGAYLVHDYCYSQDCTLDITKEESDTMLWSSLISLGMSKWKANLVYNAVKWFAKSHWRTGK